MKLNAATQSAIILGLFAIATAGSLALTNRATLPMIDCNKQRALEHSLLEVMPAERFNNVLLADVISVSDPLLGRGDMHIWRARRDNADAGAVLEAVAPDGYGGSLNLLVGIAADGTVTGVRLVPPHNETPGLGDKAELKKSDWVLGFNGHALGSPDDSGWAVKKDGGIFDSFTGATITPRAIVGQTWRALKYFEQHRDALFAEPALSTRNATSNASCEADA